VPTYSYACTECDHRFDAAQAFTDDALTTCPQCSGRLRKLFNSVGVVFKGSGFYRTDSRESGKNGSSSAGASASEKAGSSSSSDTSSSEKSSDKSSSEKSAAPSGASASSTPSGSSAGTSSSAASASAS
jgi:putative FmdB family regulatory protein